MLTEIALTPQVFYPAQGDASAWSEFLTELGHRLEPLKGLRPVIVSDLLGGSWQHQLPTVDQIRQIKDHRVREKLQRILKLIREQLLVPRPAKGDWREEEPGWVKEAAASSGDFPIERIFATQYCETDGAPPRLSRIGEDCSAFWDGLSVQVDPPMILKEQMEALNPLLMHAEWICFVSKYARGNEERFTLELARTRLQRPAGWPAPKLIDIHSERSEGGEENLEDYWRRKFETLPRGESIIRMFFWPDGSFRDRVLLAGDCREREGSIMHPTVRWGVSMQHVTLGMDRSDDHPAQWALKPRERSLAWYGRFYDSTTGSPRCPNPPLTVDLM